MRNSETEGQMRSNRRLQAELKQLVAKAIEKENLRFEFDSEAELRPIFG